MPIPTNSSRPQQYDPRYQSYNGMADDETLSSAYLGTAHVETDLARMDIVKIKAICEARIDSIMATMDPVIFVFVMNYFSEYIPSEESLDIKDPFVMEDFAMFSELPPIKEETLEIKDENAKVSNKVVSAEFIHPEIVSDGVVEDVVETTSIAFTVVDAPPKEEFKALPDPCIVPKYACKAEDVIECVLKMRIVEKIHLSMGLLESFRIGIDERGKKIGMGEHSVRIHTKDDLDRHYKSAVDRFQEKER